MAPLAQSYTPGVPSRSNPVVALLSRSGHEESIHRGAWVVADVDGTVVAHAGDPGQLVFARSSTKSVQALPLLESGAAETIGAGDAELAVAIASHSGQDIHVAAVRSLLAKAGLDEEHLRCGPQRPAGTGDHAEARRVTNNCSGKHAALLATAAHLGDPLADYLSADSRVQQAVHDAVVEISRADPASVSTGIDGCGAPTFRLPLAALATAIARMTNPDDLGESRTAACRRVVAAARSHPELVAGTSTPQFDTDLLTVSDGRLFAKTGAEGMQVVGVVGAGVAFAAKIDDGSKRSIHPLALEVLARLELISQDELSRLERWTDPIRRNLDGIEIGRHELCDEALPPQR